MAVPKQRHTKSRRDRRRGGQRKLETKQVTLCSNCNMPCLPHHACAQCGFYKGEQVVKGINLKKNKTK